MFRLITRQDASERTACPRATLYERMGRGLFVTPVKLGKRSLFPEHEVEAINAAVIAGATDDELRVLVARLHEARKPTGSEAA